MCLKLLDENVTYKVTDLKNYEQILPVIRSSLAPKLPQYYEFFSELVTRACVTILKDTKPRFSNENIRVVKVLGGSLLESSLLNGYIVTRKPETNCKEKVENCKVAVYNCPFDPT